MQHLIGQHIFDPDRITPHDRLCEYQVSRLVAQQVLTCADSCLAGYGPFTGLEGERKAEFESLLAFAGTCRSVRRAVAPIVLRSLTFRRLEDVRAMTERNWLGCVR
jgi:hypothetical protein